MSDSSEQKRKELEEKLGPPANKVGGVRVAEKSGGKKDGESDATPKASAIEALEGGSPASTVTDLAAGSTPGTGLTGGASNKKEAEAAVKAKHNQTKSTEPIHQKHSKGPAGNPIMVHQPGHPQ